MKNEASLCCAQDQKAEEPRSLFSLTFACGSRSMPAVLPALVCAKRIIPAMREEDDRMQKRPLDQVTPFDLKGCGMGIFFSHCLSFDAP